MINRPSRAQLRLVEPLPANHLVAVPSPIPAVHVRRNPRAHAPEMATLLWRPSYVQPRSERR